MTWRRALGTTLLAAAVVQCAGAPMDRARFLNRPPVTKVNDRVPAARPETRRALFLLEHYDAVIHDPIVEATELRSTGEARGVNALDQVPDSTWFTNRIGVRSVSVDEVRNGPLGGYAPEDAQPWRIVAAKKTGKDPGFLMVDTRGTRYLLKFDRVGFPGMETSAHIVVNRLLWALGYNVPEDEIVILHRDQLAIADGAVIETALGGERPLRMSDVDRELDQVNVGKDGSIRAVASEFVPGKTLGGTPAEGVRSDDPNDVIPHQNRRELRGLQPIFAWLKNTDVKESNTLDTWVEDPATPGRGYVIHYVIDFGKALGVRGWQSRNRESGYARVVDFGDTATSLVSLGTVKHNWEDVSTADFRGVGIYEIDSYRPGAFKSNIRYAPFEAMTDRDAFWAAALIARFTPEQLRAAVDAAEIGDHRIEDELVHALRARQLETARYWFSRVNPLADFEVVASDDSGTWLCFDDLLLSNHLSTVATRYRATAYDYDGKRTGWSMASRPDAAGHACVADIRASRTHGGYTIVRIDTERARHDYQPVLVHLALDPGTQRLRPIGIRRP